jgi:hypothetical protein
MKRNGSALRQGPLIKRCLVLFYLASRTALRLLTATECRQSLPSLYRRGGANMYFIDSQDNSLGWICLDEGKNPQRVHSNVFEQAAKRRTIADIRSLTAAGRFRILVLTTSDAKAALLRELFSKRPLRDVKVEIAAVPGCIELALHCP